jgi:predicted transcriptional regulator
MPRSAKQQAAEMIRNLPDQATWDDIMYELYVRQKIEQGLRDGDEGRLVSQEEVPRAMTVYCAWTAIREVPRRGHFHRRVGW